MKKMLKRALAITMAALLAASAAGCGSGTDAGDTSDASGGSAGEKKLVVAWWGNQVRNERTQAALDEYSKENPGVTFDGQFSEWSDYWNKLATASAGNSLPDIIQMDYTYISQYANNSLLLDMKPYIDKGTLDVSGIDENILDSGTIDGKVYAVCNGVNAPALLYNKTLLDEAGITVKDNMTTDEFVQMSRDVFQKTSYKTNIGYNAGPQVMEYFVRAQNKVLYEDGKLGVGSPEDLQQHFDLYELGKKEGWLIDASVFTERTIGSVEQDPLVYGSGPDTHSWCYFSYSNQLVATQKAAGDTEIGITTYPSDDPKVSDYLKPSQFFCVSANSKYAEEAVKVINYITNSEACNNILLGERGVPASAKIAEAITPKLDALDQKVVAFINDVVTPNSTKLNPPAPDGSAEVTNLLKQLEEQLSYGKISAADAAKQLFEEGNKLLSSKGK